MVDQPVNPGQVTDAGAAAPSFPTDAVAQQVYQPGAYTVGYASPMAGGFPAGAVSDTGIAFSANGTGDSGIAGAATAQGDRLAEMPPAQITQASSASEANLVIGADGQSKWNKPLSSSDGYQCKVWVDEAAKNDAANVEAQLNQAKEDLALGKNVSDGKAVNLNVPEELPQWMQKSESGSDSEKDQPGEDSPDGGGGGGGGCNGGGGSEQDPADDKKDPVEGKEDADADADTKPTDQSTVKSSTLKDDVGSQLRDNLQRHNMDNSHNIASYAGSLWNSSPMMSSLFAQYDKDGDGKLDDDERAAMEADPTYKDALKEMQDKVGDDPSLKDFKDQIGTREGLNNLSQLQLADQRGNATASDVNKVFNSDAQSSISSLAISQQLKAAGMNGSDTLPASPTAAEEAAYKEKVTPIINNLINGKHKFSF